MGLYVRSGAKMRDTMISLFSQMFPTVWFSLALADASDQSRLHKFSDNFLACCLSVSFVYECGTVALCAPIKAKWTN